MLADPNPTISVFPGSAITNLRLRFSELHHPSGPPHMPHPTESVTEEDSSTNATDQHLKNNPLSPMPSVHGLKIQRDEFACIMGVTQRACWMECSCVVLNSIMFANYLIIAVNSSFISKNVEGMPVHVPRTLKLRGSNALRLSNPRESNSFSVLRLRVHESWDNSSCQ